MCQYASGNSNHCQIRKYRESCIETCNKNCRPIRDYCETYFVVIDDDPQPDYDWCYRYRYAGDCYNDTVSIRSACPYQCCLADKNGGNSSQVFSTLSAK